MKNPCTALALVFTVVFLSRATGQESDAEKDVVVARVNGVELYHRKVFGRQRLEILRRVADRTTSDDSDVAKNAATRHTRLGKLMAQHLEEAIDVQLLRQVAAASGMADTAAYHDAMAAHRKIDGSSAFTAASSLPVEERILIDTYLRREGVAADRYSVEAEEIARFMKENEKLYKRSRGTQVQIEQLVGLKLRADKIRAARDVIVKRLRETAEIETFLYTTKLKEAE